MFVDTFLVDPRQVLGIVYSHILSSHSRQVINVSWRGYCFCYICQLLSLIKKVPLIGTCLLVSILSVPLAPKPAGILSACAILIGILSTGILSWIHLLDSRIHGNIMNKNLEIK